VETRETTPEEKADPAFAVPPRYWVAETEVLARLGSRRGHAAERAGDPPTDVGATRPAGCWLNAEFREQQTRHFLALGPADRRRGGQRLLNVDATISSAATVLGFSPLLEQLGLRLHRPPKAVRNEFELLPRQAVPRPSAHVLHSRGLDVIVQRVLELVYTAENMRSLAEAVLNCGWRLAIGEESYGATHSPFAIPHSPFSCNEEPCAQQRAELDAWRRISVFERAKVGEWVERGHENNLVVCSRLFVGSFAWSGFAAGGGGRIGRQTESGHIQQFVAAADQNLGHLKAEVLRQTQELQRRAVEAGA